MGYKIDWLVISMTFCFTKPNLIPGNEKKSGGFTNSRWNSWIHDDTWRVAGSLVGFHPIQESLEIHGISMSQKLYRNKYVVSLFVVANGGIALGSYQSYLYLPEELMMSNCTSFLSWPLATLQPGQSCARADYWSIFFPAWVLNMHIWHIHISSGSQA